jgi:hypothetical protein
MHIKTGWTPRDYLDLYVTDDGETFDLVQGGQAGNNGALAFNRILANCKTIADVYNRIFGTAWGYGFTPFSVQSIYSAADLKRIEDRCGELARAFGLDYSGKTWAAGDVVDYRDLNRWEAPFTFLGRYEGKTADDFDIIRCGTILCGGVAGDYRYHFCGDSTAYFE